MEFKRNKQREEVGRTLWDKLPPKWFPLYAAYGGSVGGNDQITLANYFKPNVDSESNGGRLFLRCNDGPIGTANQNKRIYPEQVLMREFQSYFKPNVGNSNNDGLWAGRVWTDGIYRRIADHVTATSGLAWPQWTGPNDPNWIELSYETQCETTDVLPALIATQQIPDGGRFASTATALLNDPDPAAEMVLTDLLKQYDLWDGITVEIRAAAKVVAYRSWCSAYFSYHSQSIEGDYELFDAFETQWLETQGDLPRHWTRMGLNILINTIREWAEKGSNLDVNSKEDIEEFQAGGLVPLCPFPSDQEWELARLFYTSLDDDHFEPTLLDFFQ